MAYPNMDALFYIASQGDADALELLRKTYENNFNYHFNFASNKYIKYDKKTIDFNDLIDDLFLSILKDYDSSKGSFTWYMKNVLEKRSENKISDENARKMSVYYTLDDEVDDGKRYIDLVEDEAPPISDDIAMKNFKYTISSPQKKLTVEERLKNKVLLMKYAGFKDVEICKMLKISQGVLRGISKKYNEDEDIINFKMEIK